MSIQVKADRNSLTGFLVLQVKIHGRLTAQDYSILVSNLDNPKEKQKIRIFVELTDFDGWTAGAMWHNTEFATKRFKNIERVAVVGDKYRAKGAFLFCKPFLGATIRYYDVDNLADSKEWIRQGYESGDLIGD
jgi:hypothetical protein